MGIEGLLLALNGIVESKHISYFSNKIAGIDAYAWLHRAAYSCAFELALNIKTDKYLQLPKRYLDTLIYHKIKPIVIFDGDQLPMKKEEEKRRSTSRSERLMEGKKALKTGDKQTAYKLFQQCVKITRNMVNQFIKMLKQLNIQFIVAPYEADSQLGYMFKNGQIDFVISEDSDLILFGVKKIFTKFDREFSLIKLYFCNYFVFYFHSKTKQNFGQFIDIDKIRTWNKYNSNNSGNAKKNSNSNSFLQYVKKFRNLESDLINCCVLSGCDYLDSIRGIGLRTAAQKILKIPNIDRLILDLKREKSKYFPKNYMIQFKRAILAFKYQTVYDNINKKLTHLSDIYKNNSDEYNDDIIKYKQLVKKEKEKQISLSKYNKKNNSFTKQNSLSIDIDDDELFGGNNTPNHSFTKFKSDKNHNVDLNKLDDSLDFLGPYKDNNIVIQISEGIIDARTHKSLDLDNEQLNTVIFPPKEEIKIKKHINSNPFNIMSTNNNINQKNKQINTNKKLTRKRRRVGFENDDEDDTNNNENINIKPIVNPQDLLILNKFKFKGINETNNSNNSNTKFRFKNDKNELSSSDEIEEPFSQETQTVSNFLNSLRKTKSRKRKYSDLINSNNTNDNENENDSIIDDLFEPPTQKRRLNNNDNKHFIIPETPTSSQDTPQYISSQTQYSQNITQQKVVNPFSKNEIIQNEYNNNNDSDFKDYEENNNNVESLSPVLTTNQNIFSNRRKNSARKFSNSNSKTKTKKDIKYNLFGDLIKQKKDDSEKIKKITSKKKLKRIMRNKQNLNLLINQFDTGNENEESNNEDENYMYYEIKDERKYNNNINNNTNINEYDSDVTINSQFDNFQNTQKKLNFSNDFEQQQNMQNSNEKTLDNMSNNKENNSNANNVSSDKVEICTPFKRLTLKEKLELRVKQQQLRKLHSKEHSTRNKKTLGVKKKTNLSHKKKKKGFKTPKSIKKNNNQKQLTLFNLFKNKE